MSKQIDRNTRYTKLKDKKYDYPNDYGCAVAIQVAELSTHLKQQIGAAIKKGGRIISLGHNRGKTSPYISNKFRGSNCDKLHSEMVAILHAKMDLRGARMYIARIKDVGLGMAHPCNLCMDLISESGIKTIIFTNSEGTWSIERVK